MVLCCQAAVWVAAERAGPRVPARVQLLQLRPARGHVSGRPLRHVRAAGGLAVSAGLLRRGQRCSDCFTASYIMFSPDITCGETSSRRLIESQLKFSPCGRLPPTHTATRRKLKPVFRNIQFLEDKGFVLFDQHCHSWNIILCNDLGVQFSFYWPATSSSMTRKPW